MRGVTLFVTPQHEVAVMLGQWAHIAGLEILGLGGVEPPKRERVEGVAAH
jgi:hypothetical protein